ncbi:hypothetical protein KR222_002100 [Zaprionus bogoriensis]|nr:hypothetical protein KR222_002100 [Zaprionus bogoriensis]
MNYLIQRGKVRQQAINVPDGLPELLSDITREVLRCQPTKECLCQFIIDYLHSVIVTREKAMVAKSILNRALRNVDGIISDLCVCDLGKEKSEMMANVMEECFRNFLEKRRCEMRRGKEMVNFADIDMLEELIKKCGFSEDELDRSRPAIENAYQRFVDSYMAAAKDSKGTELLYQYFRDRELNRINDIMRNQAAITLQATWRGYIVRKAMDQQICICTCMMDNEDEALVKLQDKAARVIQRFFRTVLEVIILCIMGDPCAEKETPTSHLGFKTEGEMGSEKGSGAASARYEKPALETEPEEPAVAPKADEAAPADEAPSPPAEEPPAAAQPEAAETEEAPPPEPAPEPAAEEPAEQPAPPDEEAPPPPPAEEAPPAEEPPAEAPPAEEPPAEEPPAEEPPAE